MIKYSQVAGREKKRDFFLVNKRDICGWLIKTETASLIGKRIL
jgi:hypothetical protein